MATSNTAVIQALVDENLNDQGATAAHKGSPRGIQILQEMHDSTYTWWYCVGNATDMDSTMTARGTIISIAPRAMWVKTTDSGSTTVQAAAIVTAFGTYAAGRDSNLDPNALA